MVSHASDWAPLQGDDPCPGDPDGWLPVISHWALRAQDIQALAHQMAKFTSNDADSKRIRALEEVAEEGASAMMRLSDVFSAAQETVSYWRRVLMDMQSRAQAALVSAQVAEASRVDALAQLTALGLFTEQDHSDPSLAAKKSSLDAEIFSADLVIAAAQNTVDSIRGEYERKSLAVIRAYEETQKDPKKFAKHLKAMTNSTPTPQNSSGYAGSTRHHNLICDTLSEDIHSTQRGRQKIKAS